MILKTCSPGQDDWDENLKEIVFAYRSMVHSTTKLSPFQVMLGRKPIQKESDLLGNTEELSESEIESAVNNLTKLRQQKRKMCHPHKKMCHSHKKNKSWDMSHVKMQTKTKIHKANYFMSETRFWFSIHEKQTERVQI